MTSDRAAAAAVLAWLLWPRAGRGAPAPLAGGWPMPALRAGEALVAPVVSDNFSGVKTDEHRQHLGVDITYPTRGQASLIKRLGLKRPRDIAKGGGFFVPPDVPVLAARAGEVWSTADSRRGLSVLVVHDAGHFATWYQHLEELARYWRRGDAVVEGQTLGTCGYDPSGNEMRHLHFATRVWRSGKWVPVDPEPYLKTWKVKAVHDV